MRKARSEGSDEIGQFLEWLRSDETDYTIAEWDRHKQCDASSLWQRAGRPEWHCIGGRIMSGMDLDEDTGECEECEGTGRIPRREPRLMSVGKSIEALLAMYFDIDLQRLAEEKDAMLNDIRRTHGLD